MLKINAVNSAEWISTFVYKTIREMSTGKTISIFVSGHIQCAPGYTNKTIYMTIVDGQDQPCAKAAQPVNQHFCMVQMPSMEKSFMLVEYPNLRKVLKLLIFHLMILEEQSW